MATYEMTCTDGLVGSEALPNILYGNPRMDDRVILSEGKGWILPTGYNDPGSKWTDETNVYDGNTGTFAYATLVAQDYLELTLPWTVSCERVRVIAALYEPPNLHDPQAEVDLYYDNAWNNIWVGVIPKNTWVEMQIPEGTKLVSKARILVNIQAGLPSSGDARSRLYEFEFAGEVSPKTQLSAVNTITDGVSLSEALLISWKYLLTATDGLDLSDAAVTKLEYFLTALDGLDVSDTPVIFRIFELLAADGVVHSDSTLAEVAGRLLKILTYALAYRDLKVYARPYYNQKVYTADVREV